MTTPWQPGFQGATVVPAGYNDPHNWAPASALQLVASTGTAGFALQNATPTILSWQVPNDGQLHRVLYFVTLFVSSSLTGGSLFGHCIAPNGQALSPGILAASLTGPTAYNGNPGATAVQAGSTVQLNQGSPASAGAGIVWAEIWAA